MGSVFRVSGVGDPGSARWSSVGYLSLEILRRRRVRTRGSAGPFGGQNKVVSSGLVFFSFCLDFLRHRPRSRLVTVPLSLSLSLSLSLVTRRCRRPPAAPLAQNESGRQPRDRCSACLRTCATRHVKRSLAARRRPPARPRRVPPSDPSLLPSHAPAATAHGRASRPRRKREARCAHIRGSEAVGLAREVRMARGRT